jgi:hypothetical protein|tara:strand:- start:2848 stop:3591 length:744 start_codon:yes stop_codon:yes gene_type:complete
MIYSLIIGRGESKGFPGKNTKEIMGKPLMAYPIIAAQNSKYVDDMFISTDSEEIRMIGEEYGAKYIQRPPNLSTDIALGEDVFKHGFQWIKENINANIEVMVLLFCNVVCVSAELINLGIEALRENPELDSAVSVSRYNMWSPIRARKINDQGLLDPCVPFDVFGDPNSLNCDRDSQGDVWFADMGVSVVRPRCLDEMENGLLPQKWMGQKIYPLKQEAGFDLDYEWQIPMVEWWIKKYGVESTNCN